LLLTGRGGGGAGRGGGGAGRGLPHRLAGRGGLLLELLLLLLEPALLLELLRRLPEALLRLLLESSLLRLLLESSLLRLLLESSLLGLSEPLLLLLLPLLLLNEEPLDLGLSEPLRPQTVHELLRALLLSTLLPGHDGGQEEWCKEFGGHPCCWGLVWAGWEVGRH